MDRESKARNLWVIAELNSQLFGINCAHVREMIVVPEVSKVPGTADCVRGVINLRGQVLPLLDLRKRLNMSSLQDENEALCELIDQRAGDHKRWLQELSDSVTQNREFTLTTDPHKCAFGCWYDSYKSDNLMVASFLERFDKPHKAIHALAVQVKELVTENKREQAEELIESARGGALESMLRLFQQFQELIRDTHREIAMVVNVGGRTIAASVDAIQSVEPMQADSQVELDKIVHFTTTGVVSHAARRAKDNALVLLIQAEQLWGDAQMRDLLPIAAD